MVLTSSTVWAQPKLSVQKITVLPYFHSISALEYHDKTIMAIGNDATRILLLSEDHSILDSIALFDYLNKPQEKNTNSNGIRATAVVTVANTPTLLIMGSGENRMDKSDIWLFPLKGKSYSELYTPAINIPDFYKRMRRLGITQINIDGAAEIKDHILLANAATAANSNNHFVLTEFDFWTKGATADLRIIKLNSDVKQPIRVSGLEYDVAEDLLLFSASSIPTSSNESVESYIGLIENISSKLKQPSIRPDYLLPIYDIMPDMKGKQLQSICLGKQKNSGETIIHVCGIDANNSCYVYRFGMRR